MEVIATAAETAALLQARPGAPYFLFPEDRRFPIRMTGDLPQRWAAQGPGASIQRRGLARRILRLPDRLLGRAGRRRRHRCPLLGPPPRPDRRLSGRRRRARGRPGLGPELPEHRRLRLGRRAVPQGRPCREGPGPGPLVRRPRPPRPRPRPLRGHRHRRAERARRDRAQARAQGRGRCPGRRRRRRPFPHDTAPLARLPDRLRRRDRPALHSARGRGTDRALPRPLARGRPRRPARPPPELVRPRNDPLRRRARGPDGLAPGPPGRACGRARRVVDTRPVRAALHRAHRRQGRLGGARPGRRPRHARLSPDGVRRLRRVRGRADRRQRHRRLRHPPRNPAPRRVRPIHDGPGL